MKMLRTSGIGAMLLLLAIIGLILTSVVPPSPIEAAFPGDNGKIAFTSGRHGFIEIYSMEPDGSNQDRLTDSEAHQGKPSWSPDGTKIAFQALPKNGAGEIYVMDADGGNRERFTDSSIIGSAQGVRLGQTFVPVAVSGTELPRAPYVQRETVH